MLEIVTLVAIGLLVLDHFVIEPFRVPSPSMQPTVMGSPEAGVFDRVAVDKLVYRWRDPERFEVVVFKGPFDRSASFVKRVVGMPGEWIRIHEGDLWIRASDHEPWKILRKPRAVQDELWRELAPQDGVADWEIASGSGVVAANGSIALEAGASAEFRRAAPFVLDDHLDGYPDAIRAQLPSVLPHSNQSAVGDLRVETTVRLGRSSKASIELAEGTQRHRFFVGGSLAYSFARIEELDTRSSDEPRRIDATPFFAEAATVRVAVQNADDRLSLFVDGVLEVELDIDAADDQRTSITLRAEEGPVEFLSPRVSRDVYYTSAWSKVTETRVPAGHYFMLGDNSQQSSDSRDWTLWRYALSEADGARRELRAHYRPPENPRVVVGGAGGPVVWVRDEWGELNTFASSMAEPLPPIEAPFVPRELLVGRALAVFWPLDPQRGIWRWKWVR